MQDEQDTPETSDDPNQEAEPPTEPAEGSEELQDGSDEGEVATEADYAHPDGSPIYERPTSLDDLLSLPEGEEATITVTYAFGAQYGIASGEYESGVLFDTLRSRGALDDDVEGDDEAAGDEEE